ncbi:comEA protein [Bacillus coahuilensis m2-6]|uniref:ComEA protein n=1 Tax=Bacillus coahuilensis p1.1.43 TaxID=1150625 RepID=A0A147K7K4_9BACI|nr:helix-hairpin-helix domain-containing protein [Bacillus coahuilensis]KUP06049.1 comEA protein [Bacillus coahuilensis p1.1.43]KUP07257.1 comEA protein [Bacillus coahuilensis m2-6]
MKNILIRYKIWILFLTLGLLFFLLSFLNPNKQIETITPSDHSIDTVEGDLNQKEEMKTENILIDIKGAVQSPGLYELPSESRVLDAITVAGGLTETADERVINLAQKIQDEMVIYIPEKGEVEFQYGVSQTEEKRELFINLNTATKEELETLPGIGPAKAEAIITYRDETLFSSIEEIENVPGIGTKTFESLKDYITVN